MGRAAGKNAPRRGILEELAADLGIGGGTSTPGELEQEGIGDPAQGRGWDRGIPGGLNHLANPPVRRQAVPVPAREYPFSDAILAHGVEPEGNMSDRDPRLQGVTSRVEPKFEGAPPGPDPVPVYIVEQASGPRPRALTGTKRMTLPVAGSEPVQIVSEDPGRSLIQLLNEDASHHARIGQLGDLAYDVQNGVIVGGSRLPANATSYVVIRTQGPLWAVSETSNTVAISVLTEFQIADAG